MKISFIQTGGTIDKDYPHRTKGWAFEIDEPASRRILDRLDPSFHYDVHTLLKKDSLEITDQDRQGLREFCLKLTNDRIIITHGTDTLLETASFLAGIPQKTIILTGAMLPERFTHSDAPINLGMAIGAVQHLPSGVYVAMHGLVKAFYQFKRDPQSGKFY